MINLLVVDDSAFMRMAISKMVEVDDNIKLVGEAKDGEQAVKMALSLRPTVITMDVEMPVLNGIDAVKKIMANAPCPIIMISSLTTEGAMTTIQAMDAGAVDYIAKSSSFVQLDIVKVENELRKKIHYWATRHMQLQTEKPVTCPIEERWRLAAKNIVRRTPSNQVEFIAVGSSTGGPKAVLNMLRNTEQLDCIMIIVQHMPKEFTPGFAQHLAAETGREVVEGYHGMTLKPGQIVVAPGGTDCQICQPFIGSYSLHIKKDEESHVHPSADRLFSSVAKISNSAIGVILTGMGSDGSKGAKEFANKGFPVLVQAPETCVVDGMPTAAISANVVSEILSTEDIGRRMSRWGTAA